MNVGVNVPWKILTDLHVKVHGPFTVRSRHDHFSVNIALSRSRVRLKKHSTVRIFTFTRQERNFHCIILRSNQAGFRRGRTYGHQVHVICKLMSKRQANYYVHFVCGFYYDSINRKFMFSILRHNEILDSQCNQKYL